ncbi:hypothetical protein SAMN05444274_101612 [Mariniphaga anaerophila]|uniref:Tat (Twin-arginine translocation) pathway signal sequence n=1 Tax=Mariniphaga anaerophila TaxID=1484053 RepID=A0A1M4U923_9BACT|nr:hypothetical protein [Mariniphaga anaerophila]SHE53148.1 hypothetical protein SAMN05444274_101612 [Mariniphaga anaerophila]
MNTSRRKFIKHIGGASLGTVLLPTIVSASALGKDGFVAPSDRLNMVLVGCGEQGRSDLHWFFHHKTPIQFIAACDVDVNNAQKVKKMADDKQENNDCRIYNDYRELLEKEKPDYSFNE